MAGLDDYLVPEANLDSLLGSQDQGVSVSNRASNNNLAAYVATTTDKPEELEAVYRATSSELEADPSRAAINNLVQMAKDKNIAKAKSGLIDFLADPEYSDEDKASAAQELMNTESELYNIRNSVSLEALEEDSGEENSESEFVRVSFADVVDEVNAYKREAQAILNSEVARSDTNVMNALGDAMEYLTPFVESKFAGDILQGLRDGEDWAYNETFTLLGNSKKDMKEMVQEVSVNDRADFVRALVNVVNESSGIALADENDFARVDMLRTFLEDGYYEDEDVLIDNIVSVLDMTIVGGPAGRVLKRIGKASGLSRMSVADARDAVRRSYSNRVQPTSVSQNLKDTNPQKAKAAHDAAAQDKSGEAAQALYGTGREESVAADLAPEVGTESGKVKSKVANIEELDDIRNVTPAQVEDFAAKTGATYYFPAEKAQMRARAVNDMEQVNGMEVRKEMFQVEEVADGVNIKGVYGPSKSGFKDPQDAIDMAKWALRDQGVTDQDLTLLVREGSEYVPTTAREIRGRAELSDLAKKVGSASGKKARKLQEQARKAGLFKKRQPDYLVQVNYNYKFDPNDISQWAEADVKYNIFDRWFPFFTGKSGQGSLQQMMMDPASNLHPNITLSANVAVDRGAEMERQLLELGKGFADKFTKIGKDRQAVLDDYIKRANHDGVEFNYRQMVADGMTPDEMDALKSWREYWDTVYHLENRDFATTLRNQGFKEFVDVNSDTRLFAKPVSRQSVGKSVKVYDQQSDTIKAMTSEELSELYRKEGTLARMKQPINMGDDVTEHVVVTNSPGANYLRDISPSTNVLNYRKGYYTVHYKDPQFIDKVVYNSKGEEMYRKAVATAGTIGDANLKARRMKDVDADEFVEYNVRRDVKAERQDFDTYWDIQQAKGRTSQKVRGKRLEDSTSNVDDPTQAPILGPVDSMVLSAKSVSRRVSMRNVLEVHKTRFINQFKDFLPKNPVTKEPTFPSSTKDVVYRGVGNEDPRRLADARTTFNYVNYLENGFINALDESYKATLRRLSDLAGHSGNAKIEKALQWASNTRGPSAMGKNAAFNLYLATNPLRQLIVQGHQASQLAANFPGWITSGKAGSEVMTLTMIQMGMTPPKHLLKSLGMSMDEAKSMYKQWRDSGLSASIDKQNLIRGALADMADEVARRDFKPLTFLRKIGFDAGENFNMMTAWLAHRHRALKDGRSLDDLETLDDISGRARNFTYNMNAAGDMPYNQNALALIFQFMQVPHKSMLTMTANRNMTKKQKLQLLGFNAVMYTLPPAAMLSLFGDILPDEGGARDLVVNGLEGATLNKLLSLSTGEDTYIDWSGLSPVDMFGTYDFIHSLFTTDVGTILSETPSGQLLFGGNPRITNFAKTASRYFNLVDDYESPTTFGDVAHSFASMSSGYSNAYKAAYARKYGFKINSLGGVTDPNVTTAETIAQVLGFNSMDEAQYYWINQETYEKSQAYQQDVEGWYRDLKRHLLRDGISQRELEYQVKVLGEAWRVFGNDSPRAKQIIEQQLRRDIQNGDVRLYEQVWRMNGILPAGEVKALIESLPDMDREKKDKAKEALDFMYEYREED